MPARALPGVRPPAQSRSRRTFEAILDATESLLDDRLFDALSITEILDRAGISAGSFYARFDTKDAILPALLDRYERDRTARLRAGLAPERWRGLSFPQAVHRFVSLVADHFRDQRGLVCAFVMHFRAHPGAFDTDARRRLDGIYDEFAERLLGHRRSIAHDDPEAAVRTAIAFVISAARDQVLFGTPPHYSSVRLSHARLLDGLGHMMLGFLRHAPPAARP